MFEPTKEELQHGKGELDGECYFFIILMASPFVIAILLNVFK